MIVMKSFDVIVYVSVISLLVDVIFVVGGAAAASSDDVLNSNDEPVDESSEYCMTEAFKAECPDNQAIMMRRSRYGRMRIGRCVRTDFGFVGCQADVLHVTDRRCSGRRRCSVRVADSLFEQTAVSGCNAELKFYLEATYDCVPVAVAKPPSCRITATPQAYRGISTGTRFITSTTTQDKIGIISSGQSVPSSPTCGSDAMPWLIEAAPGQQIRFTLHDFSSAQRQSAQSPQQPTGANSAGRPAAAAINTDKSSSSSSASNSESFCYTYAVLREPPAVGPSADGTVSGSAVASRRYTVCGRRERRSVVYRSSGNAVEVRVTKQMLRSSKTSGHTSNDEEEDDRAYFLLEYEAVGCANPPVEAGVSWLSRDGDTATFGCTIDGRKWTLRCVDDSWSGGATFNCTRGLLQPGAMERFSVTQWVLQLPVEVSAAIVIGLAFIVGLTIFVVGVVLIQRRRRYRLPKSSSGHHRLSLQPPSSLTSDPRRCRGAIGGNTAIDPSVGLLDPSTGGGGGGGGGGGCKMDNVDQSWRRPRVGSADPFDAGCRSMIQPQNVQPYRRTPDGLGDRRPVDVVAGSQFYSSTGASENEYAYVWDQPESTAETVGGAGVVGPKSDASSPPSYPYWQLQQRTESTQKHDGDDDASTVDSQQQYPHPHPHHRAGTANAVDSALAPRPFYQHHQQLQQQQQRGYGGCSVMPQGEYETTTSRNFTTLDYVGREPYCDIVNDG